MPFRLQVRRYRLPFRTPLRTAHGLWTEREGLLLRLEAVSGRVGYGEIAPMPEFGTETLAQAEEICRGLGGRLGPDILAEVPEKFGCVRFALGCCLDQVGREAQGAEREGRRSEGDVAGGGDPGARSDPPSAAGGRSRSLALAATGRSGGAPAPTKNEPNAPGTARSTSAAGEPNAPGTARSPNRLPVAALLAAGPAALEQFPARLEEGYLSFKWKVAVGRPEDELGILDDLVAGLPTYAKLRLDANGGWDRRQAAKWLQRCAERPVEFVEQPLAPADEDGLRGLAADYPVTLALDESVVRLAEARHWQSLGWPGVFVVKPALCGPLGEIEAWARGTKADVVLSSAIETVVARAAIVPWALRSGVTRRALGFGIGEIFESREANGPLLGALADAGWDGRADALWGDQTGGELTANER